MISFSVAVDPNMGIGFKGNLPWHIKEELQLFKTNTSNKNLIMGQKTYDNLPNKLTDRHIVIVSIDPNYQSNDENVEVCYDLIEFLKEHQDDKEEYVVCGGAAIYKQAIPYCTKAYVSFIKKEYEVDKYFDGFNLDEWKYIKKVDHEEFVEAELERI